MNKCYYNGKVVEQRNIVSVYNGSFLYGINCFEGMRGYWDSSSKQIILLDLKQHIDRLFSSADRLRFNYPISKDAITSELREMMIRDKVTEDIYIRITFFIDGETSWIEQENISYLISIRSMGSSLMEDPRTRNYSLHVSSVTRNSELSTPPSIKAGGNYLNSRYAKLDAMKHGFDDALIINQKGSISESTGSCIFFIKGDSVLTPSLDCDILPSITRRRIIALCKNNRIEIVERHFRLEEVMSSDAVFLCGSMMEIMPVTQIDGRNFETGNSSIYNRIVNLFQESLVIEHI
jgi:branched-chain amino acid aminotransferase